eukprot:CAMPEP_0203761208 /NCGR_PEP_ID=MMETSP0098-20131031/14345_1 /ASSEMBLY_ACC=CAM_ASM_000208 /TAXON_ID=96639 /ORGANISM=" , Strain NY0313808BC1" /LENGTH=534 /DNA_ID=CAMNT_0050655101 /DNA_START=160 /DNA_END=1761 /DNA_ORIENTATION=-
MVMVMVWRVGLTAFLAFWEIGYAVRIGKQVNTLHWADNEHGKSYKAAAASWVSNAGFTQEDYVNSTLGMTALIEQAAMEDCDIIVFPETSINMPPGLPMKCPWELAIQSAAEHVPLVSNSSTASFQTPCGNSSWANRPVMTSLSCAAKKNKIYVVATLFASVLCSDGASGIGTLCPSGGVLVLNTIVTFDSDGQLVGRYFKRNLAQEAPGATQPTPTLLKHHPDNPILRTNFGVDFGLITCFDFTAPYPLEAYLEMGIKNIIWPNQFTTFSTLGTQVGLAQGLSKTLGLNIIVAGNGAVANGIGVFSSGRALAKWDSPSICNGTLETINDQCLRIVSTKVKASPPRITETKQFVKRYPEDDLDVVYCAAIPQKSISAVVPALASMPQSQYQAYMNRTFSGGLCKLLKLEPGATTHASIQDSLGTTCSAMIKLASNETSKTFILRVSSVSYIEGSPCRAKAEVCNLVSPESYLAFDTTGTGTWFDSFQFSQVITSRGYLGKQAPLVVGDGGVTKTFETINVDVQQNSNSSVTHIW